LDQDVVSDFSKLEKQLLHGGHMIRALLGTAYISIVDAQTLYDVCCRQLDIDNRFLLRHES